VVLLVKVVKVVKTVESTGFHSVGSSILARMGTVTRGNAKILSTFKPP